MNCFLPALILAASPCPLQAIDRFAFCLLLAVGSLHSNSFFKILSGVGFRVSRSSLEIA